MSFHDGEARCRGCEIKLQQVHPQLVVWFYWVKEMHPDVHIAQGWRGEIEQNADFAAHRSEKEWPNSKHNFMDPNTGEPCSLALDIAQNLDTKAIFSKEFCEQVNEETKLAGFPIRWGGTFISLPDYDHFEYEP